MNWWMSPWARLLVVLAAALATGGLSWTLSVSAGGVAGRASIVRKKVETLPFEEASGVHRLVTSLPVWAPRFGEIIVPKEIYDRCAEGDEVSFRGAGLGWVGTEAIEFEVTRGGSSRAQWREGDLYFRVSLVGMAVLAGGIVWTAVALAGRIWGPAPE